MAPSGKDPGAREPRVAEADADGLFGDRKWMTRPPKARVERKSHPGRARGGSSRTTADRTTDVPKHGEPHGRLQGATNLHDVQRSKPSKSGGTTRAERVRRVATPGRRLKPAGERQPHKGSREQAALTSKGRSREWTLGSDVDGGANIDNPKRGVPIWMDRRRPAEEVSGPPREGDTEKFSEGPREQESVSEGEAKVTRVWPLVTRPLGAFGQAVPRRSVPHSNECGTRPWRASGEGQRFATWLNAGETALRLRSQWRRHREP